MVLETEPGTMVDDDEISSAVKPIAESLGTEKYLALAAELKVKKIAPGSDEYYQAMREAGVGEEQIEESRDEISRVNKAAAETTKDVNTQNAAIEEETHTGV